MSLLARLAATATMMTMMALAPAARADTTASAAMTPAQAQVQLDDPFGNDASPQQSIWFPDPRMLRDLHLTSGPAPAALVDADDAVALAWWQAVHLAPAARAALLRRRSALGT